jgi:pimeloyl-ACP methyl ester carboxylesterase
MFPRTDIVQDEKIMVSINNGGPSLVNSLLEFRAGFEACALPSFYPALLMARRNQDQPVLVIPGFTASDHSTFFVRQYLRKLGYDAYGWSQGSNNGLTATSFDALEDRLADIYQRTGRPVSLVGWSLGGFFVRALANRHAEKVRSIITVATPFAMPTPRAVNRVINRLYGYLNPHQQMDEFFVSSDMWEPTPALPSTSVYSQGDGVNSWNYCLDKEGPLSENVRVYGSHCGLAVNPMVFYVLADRLGQSVDSWQPFTGPTAQLRGLAARVIGASEDTAAVAQP